MASDRQAELDALNAAERKKRAERGVRPPGANWEPRTVDSSTPQESSIVRNAAFAFRDSIQYGLMRGNEIPAGSDGERRRFFKNEIR